MSIHRLALTVCLLVLTILPGHADTLSSSNIPLDSTIYLYLEKLSGMGLMQSDVRGLKPISRAEAARLTKEAEQKLRENGSSASEFAGDLIRHLQELLPREISLQGTSVKPKMFDYNPIVSARLRYVYLDGEPRNYERISWDPAHQSAFGFIGGDLRPLGNGGPVHVTGTEGTPLLENNNGTIHPSGSSGELRVAGEGYFSRYATLYVEPKLVVSRHDKKGSLEKGYATIGGGGLALEVKKHSPVKVLNEYRPVSI